MKIAKKTGVMALIVLVSLYLLIPVRMCGTSCPTCLGSSAKASASQTEQMPSCHQSQTPTCHQSQAGENQCSSQPGKPHQCCMKPIPSLASNQKFIPVSQNVKLNKAEIAPAFCPEAQTLASNFNLRLTSDKHHHKLKASPKLFLLNSSLLI